VLYVPHVVYVVVSNGRMIVELLRGKVCGRWHSWPDLVTAVSFGWTD